MSLDFEFQAQGARQDFIFRYHELLSTTPNGTALDRHVPIRYTAHIARHIGLWWNSPSALLLEPRQFLGEDGCAHVHGLRALNYA